jgi:hypothetical protein
VDLLDKTCIDQCPVDCISRAASLGMLDHRAGQSPRQPTSSNDFPVLTVVSGRPGPALYQAVAALIASGLPFVLVHAHRPLADARPACSASLRCATGPRPSRWRTSSACCPTPRAPAPDPFAAKAGQEPLSAYSAGPAPARNYSVEEVTALFDGTELVPPGVVDARQWHPGWSDLPALPFRTGQAIGGVGLLR